MIPSPEQSSQVGMFGLSAPPFQQESDTRSNRNDGLKNGLKSLGCGWISVALSGTKNEENHYFSILNGRY
jgi:hypothetical protein